MQQPPGHPRSGVYDAGVDDLSFIEDDPDDVERFLVAADLLQTQGDPRGEFAAIQYALSQHPDDERLTAREGELLEAHRKAWLGPFAGMGSRKLHAGWRLGWIDEVTLHIATMREAKERLDELLELPTARFMRRLTIEVKEDIEDYAPLYETLAREKRPKTLRRLKFGKTRPPEDVLAALPRLAAGAGARWNSLMEEVGKARRRRLQPLFETSQLPPLTLREPDLDLAWDPTNVVVGLRMQYGKRQQLPVSDAMRQLFTPHSLDAFVLAMVEQWAAEDTPSNRTWVLRVVGALGGDRCATWMVERLEQWSHARAMQFTEALVQMGTPIGVAGIWMMARSGEGSRADHAAEVLRVMARNRGCLQDDLMDRAVPRNPDLSHEGRFDIITRRWMEWLMVSGHQLSQRDFEHYVATGPRAELAQRLVWGAYRGTELVATFAVSGVGGSYWGSDEAVVGLPSDTRIGVPHPVEMAWEEQLAWDKAFGGSRLQPFLQLRRPVAVVRPEEHGKGRLERPLFATNWDRDRYWHTIDELGVPWEESHNYYYEEMEGENSWQVRLNLRRHGKNVTIYGHWPDRQLKSLFLRDRRTFGDLDPVAFSEAVASVEQHLADPQDKSYPRVENVGRAKPQGQVPKGLLARVVSAVKATAAEVLPPDCGVCDRALNGSLRVAVQRGRTRGKTRSVWIHWECAPLAPEIQAAWSEGGDPLGRLKADCSALGIAPPPFAAPRATAPSLETGQATAPQPAPSSPTATQGRRITLSGADESRILKRCPDAAAVKATKKVAQPTKWSDLGRNGTRAWGLAVGSSTYRTWVDLETFKPECDCPSRKRPCKHGIALLLMVAQGEVDDGAPPTWLGTRFPLR